MNSPKHRNGTKKVRYALVALGNIAQVAVLPGFLNAGKNSELTALVSSDPTKLRQLSKHYGVRECYHYEDYDACLRSGDVDAVYIALPNHLHCEFAVRAAEAGIHVLCEKPLGLDENECLTMMRACTDHDVRLMTAYRLHFEHSNLEAARLVHSGKIGEPRLFTSSFTMQVKEGIRTQAAAGGGTLYDIGIYCINAARYLFREEPVEVFAFSTQGTDPRFREVDEMTTASLRFPGGRLASFTASFGAADTAWYEVVGTRGRVQLNHAYEFAEKIHLEVATGTRTRRLEFEKRDQFGPEIVHFSDCILKHKEPEPSGLEGLLDVHIICALYESAAKGIPISLVEFQRERRPTPKQEIYRPHRKPLHLVHTSQIHR